MKLKSRVPDEVTTSKAKQKKITCIKIFIFQSKVNLKKLIKILKQALKKIRK